MAEHPPLGASTPSEVRARLDEVAALLHQTPPADPKVRQALAEFVDEMNRTLDVSTLPPSELAHLADSAAHLTEALQRQQEPGVLTRARDRLEQAVWVAGDRAPLLTGLAQRLLDALSGLGI
jgi:hypothetical protein